MDAGALLHYYGLPAAVSSSQTLAGLDQLGNPVYRSLAGGVYSVPAYDRATAPTDMVGVGGAPSGFTRLGDDPTLAATAGGAGGIYRGPDGGFFVSGFNPMPAGSTFVPDFSQPPTGIATTVDARGDTIITDGDNARLSYAPSGALLSVTHADGTTQTYGAPQRPAAPAQLWFSAIDPATRQFVMPQSSLDFSQMLRPGADDATALAHIRVFQVYVPFILAASDADLRGFFGFLNQHGIALALEAGPLTPGPTGAGSGVEGYLSPGLLPALAQRIHALGGNLRYLAMDEPLFWGHVYNGPNAAFSSITSLAQNAAANVAAVRKIFPHLVVGDVEPFGTPLTQATWSSDIARFLSAYRQASGQALGFFDADIGWTGNWKPDLAAVAATVHGAGMKLGVIYNGNGQETTDIGWTTDALQHAAEVEADPAIRPDQAVIQTWEARPARLLPESQPGTLTNLVTQYVADAPVWRAQVASTLPSPIPFLVADATTGTMQSSAGTPYQGPASSPQQQYLYGGQDNLAVTAQVPNVLIATGGGDDTLVAMSGRNVLDAGAGTNLLVSGSGTDIFIADGGDGARLWDSLANFHPGDMAILRDFVPGLSSLSWQDGQGQPGLTGATLHASVAGDGHDNARITFVGQTTAQVMANFHLSTGIDSSGHSYLAIS